MKDTQKNKLKAVTGMNEIPFVMEGIAAETSGHVISENGMSLIAEALEAADAQAAGLTAVQASLETAQAATATAETALATATETIATRDARIAELEAQVEELEADGGVTNTSRALDPAKKVKVKSYESAEDPINKMIDGILGAPKKKETE
jgi:transcriptional accessory protein Tex/SPT6